MRYGGFWRRLGAYLLDVLVWLPPSLVSIWLSSHFRLYYCYYVVPGMALGLWFHVYLVKRYGGTPGKLLMGLRITRLDGSPAGYQEALLRYFVLMVLTAFTSVAYGLAALHMTDAEYLSLTFKARAKHLIELAPSWYPKVSILMHVWVWSEFIVMLTNEKRRALHDFIAGTVVIHLSRQTPSRLDRRDADIPGTPPDQVAQLAPPPGTAQPRTEPET